MKKKFFLTTAIPYVNAAPHLGHALEFVQADVIARYHRLLGENTFFLTGTDENSLKNALAAEKIKIKTKKLCDENAKKFYDLKNLLDISFDEFIRTTEKRHFLGAQKLWLACQKDIYKRKYRGLYCIGCETFYHQDELIEGKCPEHQTKPEEIAEENYFFRLSRYQKKLEEIIKKDKIKIIPQTKKNEVLTFIKRGLKDFSISRSINRAHGWGIPVPNDQTQIIYVWFDALANYITALGYGLKEPFNLKFKNYWPADLHLIGKGIIRFHAVYWPAMLLSAGLPLPKKIFVHGYLTVNGQKISKSLGNIIDPFSLVKKYGKDAVRYYLLREVPPFADGNFSEERFKELYNADLANGLGNLVSRITKLASETENLSFNIPDLNFLKFIKTLHPKYKLSFDNFRFDEALAYILNKIRRENLIIDEKKPWEKTGKERQKILNKLIIGLLEITVLLEPFLPETTKKIKNYLCKSKITPTKPIFPRIS